MLENVGHEIENIDFIYYAKSYTDKVNPLLNESKELYWFSEKDIIENNNIKPHIKTIALDALRILSNI